MARSTTTNVKAYCEAPRRLPEVITRKRSGSPTQGVALQHDDPTVHSAHGIQRLLQVVHRVILEISLVFSLPFVFELVFICFSETTVSKSPTPQ